MHRFPVAACGVVVVAALIGGCGASTTPVASGVPVTSNLVSAAEINAMPAGSPQRTLLQWWRYIQYNELTDFVSLLATPLRQQQIRSGQAAADVAGASGALNSARPHITQVTYNGDRATIFTQIVIRQAVGATRYVQVRTPQAFALVRQGGAWRMADDLYVQLQAETANRAALAATRTTSQ
jgi:hypothetical protein